MESNSMELKALEKACNEALERMGAQLRQAQDTTVQALEESKKNGGVIEAKTNEKLAELGKGTEKVQGEVATLRTMIVELAQKVGTQPQGGSPLAEKSIAELVTESPEYKRAQAARQSFMDPVNVGSFHRKTQIINATGQNQPLVPDQRLAGIIVPNEQRLYVRDLLPQARTESNLIQYVSEATFTNNARPQGDTSPGGIEGEVKAESAMTFTLSNAPVVTIAHWIPASRQVLSDAPMLQGHISNRLIYGLKLEEEQEFLTGNGTAGEINGINNQAAAYSYGVTNDTILDTLLKALLQVSLSNYEADGFVLHPIQWYGAMALKDTTNRYLFSDPQSMVAPRVWAKPVVASQTQTQGKFTAGAFRLGAQIWDREDATVRIAEQHSDFFTRNMVAILAEERTALTVYRTTAFVYGNTSHAG